LRPGRGELRHLVCGRRLSGDGSPDLVQLRRPVLRALAFGSLIRGRPVRSLIWSWFVRIHALSRLPGSRH